MATIKKDGNFMGLPMNIARGNPIPLDKSSIWYSYNEMMDYAKNNPVAYVGQILGLVDESENKATPYIILNTQGDLQKIGNNEQVNLIQADNTSILIDNNIIALKNWGLQYYKFIPDTENSNGHYELQTVDEDHPWPAGLEPKVTSENGEMVLAWFEPNLTSVEGVNDQITSLQTSVTDIQKNILSIRDEFNEKIATINHFKRLIVDSIEEIDIWAEDAETYIYMILASPNDSIDKYNEYIVIKTIDENNEEVRVLESIGTLEVDLSNYVSINAFNTELDKKVSIIPGYSLVENSQILKLSEIEDGAQKNYIVSVDSNNFQVDNGKLFLNEILVSQVKNLEDILKNKVDTEEGKGLSSNDFTNQNLKDLQNTIENFQIVNSKIISIENILNDTEEQGEVVPGLISIVTKQNIDLNLLETKVEKNQKDIAQLFENFQPIDGSHYITKELFETTVGGIDELQSESETLLEQVHLIKEAITWSSL